MIPDATTPCPRCGLGQPPDARQCSRCGQDLTAPWALGPPARPGQTGWGMPRPDQTSGKTLWLSVGCVLVILVFIVLPILILTMTAANYAGPFRPGDVPFPSFGP